MSDHRSVCPLHLCKNRVSWLFLATVRSYTETCFESIIYYLVVSPVCSSICLSIYVIWSIHAKTQSRRIVALSGLLINEWMNESMKMKVLRQEWRMENEEVCQNQPFCAFQTFAWPTDQTTDMTSYRSANRRVVLRYYERILSVVSCLVAESIHPRRERKSHEPANSLICV